MKQLFMGVAALAILAGCGGSEEAGNSASDAAQAVQGELGKLSDITIRAGDPAEAADALAALKLDSSGAGLATFADSKVDGDGATFTDVVVAGGEVNIGKVELDGLDMVDGGASFSKLVVSDVTTSSDDGDVSLDNFSILNPSPELAAFLAKGFSGEDPGDFPALEQISFDAISFGDFEVAGMDGVADNVMKIADISLRGMGDGELEAAVLSGLSFNALEDGEALVGGIKKMAVYGADYDFVQEIQALGEGAGEDEVMALVMSAMSDATNPPYDGMAMEDVSFEGSGVDFDLPSLDVIVNRDSQDRMTSTVLKPMTMSLSADADGGEMGAELAQGLSMLGYKELTFKAEGLTNYDPDADIVSYEAGKNYFELVNGAKISYGAKFEGFSQYSQAIASAQTEYGPDPDAMMAAVSNMVIHDFTMSIDDDSLVDRIFTLAASQSGEDPEAMRAQAVQMLGLAPLMGAQTGVDVALITEATSALSEFLQEPGELTFSLSPSTPLNIGNLIAAGDPSVLTKDALGFSASHK